MNNKLNQSWDTYMILSLLSVLWVSCRPSQTIDIQPYTKTELVRQLEAIFYADDFAAIPDREFNAADYGAVGDGKTLNTEAIQQAIDTASAAGGGKVVFPAGTYVSGALFLKSNVELHLAEDVIIQAIQHDEHFPDKWTRVAGIEMDWPAALINIYEQENVRITGTGVIDGNGKYWWDKFWGDPPRSGGMWVDYTEKGIRWAVDYDCKRVRPVVVYKSKEVLLKNFTVERAGFWTISLTFSEQVHVDSVTIRNNIGGYGPSSDGINTDSSKDILVENCDIDCNDDNLCIKAGRDADGLRVNRPAENIVYRSCITRAGHGLFTIGSETSGGIRNVEVYNLEAMRTNTGIRFKSAKVRGGLIENILFHDIKMTFVDRPFQFELNWYPEYSYPTIPDSFVQAGLPRHWEVMTTPVEPPEKGIPEFRNIRLDHITVIGAERGFYANAFPEKPISNLHWKNVYVEAERGGSLNHAANWTMENVILKTATDEFIKLQNSQEIELPEWTQLSSEETKPVLTAEEQIAHLLTEDTTVIMVVINPTGPSLIAANDTTTFSEAMTVYIFKDKDQQFRYYEPLGDGFYFSPVMITQTGSTIKIQGERKHDWTFYIHHSVAPESVPGADEWTYDEHEQLLVVRKNGMQFEMAWGE